MAFKRKINTGFIRSAGNFIFVGLLLLVFFNTGAKAWVLRQLMTVGLFSANIKKDQPGTNGVAHFSYRDESGRAYSTSDLRGKVVFINFWATWCPPCVAEMPSLNDLYNQFRDDDQIAFLFINEDDNAEKATTFLKSKGYSIPVFMSTQSIPAEIYTGTLPTTVVINKEGKIIFKHEGLANYNSSEFIKQLKALL